MLSHEEKLTLVRDLIDAGVTDTTVIISSIKHLEKELFIETKKQITTLDNLSAAGKEQLDKDSCISSKSLID